MKLFLPMFRCVSCLGICGKGALAIAIMLALWCVPVMAHKLAPSSLTLEELRDGYYRVSYQRPQFVPRSITAPKVSLPEHCQEIVAPETHAGQTPTGIAVYLVSEVDCGKTNLFGSSVSVRPLQSGSMVMTQVSFLNGRSVSALLSPGQTELHIKEDTGVWSVTRDYIVLGVEHILSGYDHLLFVLGLLLLVGNFRSIVLLISAFTVGHSISLSLVALNATPLPSSVADFFIAFSILYLAVTLSHSTDKRGLLGSHPMWMAVGFGLLHGLGFAGALLEIGLPLRDTVVGLLSFNVGVELGQLSVIFVAFFVAQYLPSRLKASFATPSIHVMGAVASYWCIERSIGLLF